jgi:hypothetical protein
MIRFLVGGLVLACGTLGSFAQTAAPSDNPRTAPMRFELRREGPVEACGKNCQTWVSAVGTITSYTPKDFIAFARAHDLKGATIAFDSSGGSVHGAMALGREVRRLGMITTVGRTVDVPSPPHDRRAKLLRRAACESMCAFVLLAGVQRYVPADASVLVHQIWLGDRRDDATAAIYSAEDLVLVQRDIGRLAVYTMEMGGGIDLLEIALRVPPWEPMRRLSRDELRRVKLDTIDTVAVAPPAEKSAATAASTLVANGSRGGVAERGWAFLDRPGEASLTRHHPLTVEGDEIGSFDLIFSCSETADSFAVTYAERRFGENGRSAPALKQVSISVGRTTVPLKIVSEARSKSGERNSFARGTVPAALLKAYADAGIRSALVETSAGNQTDTAIRVGNAGLAPSFAQLAATCEGTGRRNLRADLVSTDAGRAASRPSP